MTSPAPADSAEPAGDEIREAMMRASRYMHESVAVRGGHVWVVSDDLERRWGEVPARPTQIWLQGGTESVGQVMLDAYDVTGDKYYLGIARDAADAIIYGQTPEGGWHYFIDFDPAGIESWYASTASRFIYGYEEYRHYYGNATFDDQVTPNTARFLQRFYETTLDPAYRPPLLEALDFVLESQYPNGLWPQRYPLRYDYAHDGLADYTSYYTLNDGATQANVELLLEAWKTFGNSRYFDAAKRAVDGLIAIQGPADQGVWAEQYDLDDQPVAARTHEPAGYVVRESLGVIDLLYRFWLITGDRRYLAPVPRAFDWFERINDESASDGYPRPRYWAPGTNRPVYVVPIDERTPEGYGKYIWTSDASKASCDGRPCEASRDPIVDVAALEKRYEELASLDTQVAREDRLQQWRLAETESSRASRTTETAAEIIAALDEEGAWVVDDLQVNEPNMASGDDNKKRVTGISTRIFIDRMSALIESLREEQ